MLPDIPVERVTNIGLACPPQFHFHHLRCQPITALWLTLVREDEFAGIEQSVDHTVFSEIPSWKSITVRVYHLIILS